MKKYVIVTNLSDCMLGDEHIMVTSSCLVYMPVCIDHWQSMDKRQIIYA